MIWLGGAQPLSDLYILPTHMLVLCKKQSHSFFLAFLRQVKKKLYFLCSFHMLPLAHNFITSEQRHNLVNVGRETQKQMSMPYLRPEEKLYQLNSLLQHFLHHQGQTTVNAKFEKKK